MRKRVFNASRHHRKSRSHGGANTSANISIVPDHKHRAYHTLFADKTPQEVADILTDVWIDPDFIMIAISKRHMR
jgi:hypothetical protein